MRRPVCALNLPHITPLPHRLSLVKRPCIRSVAYTAPTTRKPKVATDGDPTNKDAAEDGQETGWFARLLPSRTRVDAGSAEGRRKRGRAEDSDEEHQKRMAARKVKEEIKQLEAELRETESDSDVSEEFLLSFLSEPDRAKLAKAFADRRIEWARLMVRLPGSDEISQSVRLHVRKLNKMLQNASKDISDPESRKSLWQAYARAKWRYPGLPRHIPDESWELLWQTQSLESPSNRNRVAHLQTLLEDMLSVGRQCTQQMRLMQIESVFLDADPEEALEQWEISYGRNSRTNRALAPDELELGIRITAAVGELDRAQQMLQQLLNSYSNRDPRIILPLIEANAKVGDPYHFRQAWSLYLLLKQRLSSDITMDDYDAVTLTFLNADRADLALGVFRDMMLPTTSQSTAPKLVKRISQLQSASNNKSDLNSVSLTGLMALPRQYQNKFFFGSWLKKLIGMRQLSAAAQVVELMFERGIIPAPMHLNGLANALFRSGKEENCARAESLAWAMIDRRLEFVWRRKLEKKEGQAQPKPSIYQTEDRVVIPPFLRRPVPHATIETFSVLAVYYLRRGHTDHIRHLNEMRRLAEIPMDSHFITHYFYSKLQTREHRNAWRLFNMAKEKVRPSVEILEALWNMMAIHVDKTKTGNRKGFPFPRQLFKVTMNWLQTLKPERRDRMLRGFDRNMYTRILSCFSLIRDVPGLLVAMHALKSRVGILPNVSTLKRVVLLLAQTGFKEPNTRRQRLKMLASPLYERNTMRTTRVLEALYLRRNHDAFNNNFDIYQVDFSNRGEELLDLLSELIRVVLKRGMTPEEIEGAIEEAKSSMRVEDVTTGDVDSFHVA